MFKCHFLFVSMAPDSASLHPCLFRCCNFLFSLVAKQKSIIEHPIEQILEQIIHAYFAIASLLSARFRPILLIFWMVTFCCLCMHACRCIFVLASLRLSFSMRRAFERRWCWFYSVSLVMLRSCHIGRCVYV